MESEYKPSTLLFLNDVRISLLQRLKLAISKFVKVVVSRMDLLGQKLSWTSFSIK
jgi:hypothetical protein